MNAESKPGGSLLTPLLLIPLGIALLLLLAVGLVFAVGVARSGK